MSDLISRADAIEMAVDVETPQGTYERAIYVDDLMALPSADAVSREEYEELYHKAKEVNGMANDILADFPSYKELVSADAEPKWNCTANFVAEQLDRLRKMTDEEKWEFFRKFFGMGDAVQGEWIEKNSHTYICGDCGFEQAIYGNLNEYNYCPSCGARMKGGDDE